MNWINKANRKTHLKDSNIILLSLLSTFYWLTF